jgi:hypothetical protein
MRFLTTRAAQFVLVPALASVLLGSPRIAHAQTDEIQVYTAEIAEPGTSTFTLHGNYIAIGRTLPDFPGGIVPNGDFNGVPEFARGITDWWELGAYLPFVYSVDQDARFWLDGAKIRSLFVSPHAKDRTLFYGCNFELSYNQPQWSPTRWAIELRPILGLHVHHWELAVNPIVGVGLAPRPEYDFAPAWRAVYHPSEAWAGGLELYESFGPPGNFAPTRDQQQELFALLDYENDRGAIEFGVGAGLTRPGSDPLVFKLILSPSLDRK